MSNPNELRDLGYQVEPPAEAGIVRYQVRAAAARNVGKFLHNLLIGGLGVVGAAGTALAIDKPGPLVSDGFVAKTVARLGDQATDLFNTANLWVTDHPVGLGALLAGASFAALGASLIDYAKGNHPFQKKGVTAKAGANANARFQRLDRPTEYDSEVRKSRQL